MAYDGEDGSFRVGVFDLFHFDDLFFAEDFDGVEAVVVTRANEMNTAEGAGAEGSFNREIREGVTAGEFALLGGNGEWERGGGVGTCGVGRCDVGRHSANGRSSRRSGSGL